MSITRSTQASAGAAFRAIKSAPLAITADDLIAIVGVRLMRQDAVLSYLKAAADGKEAQERATIVGRLVSKRLKQIIESLPD